MKRTCKRCKKRRISVYSMRLGRRVGGTRHHDLCGQCQRELSDSLRAQDLAARERAERPAPVEDVVDSALAAR